jgi:oligopeptide/dipeptide ABC transporter ATP-binding protein
MSFAPTGQRAEAERAPEYPMLQVDDLRVYFHSNGSWLSGGGAETVKAVDGVSFEVRSGETFSLVGESGCGKTTTSRAILRIQAPTSGTLRWRGKDLQALNRQEIKDYRSSVQAVFQDPFSSMNPRLRIGNFIAEPLLLNSAIGRMERKERAQDVLRQVGLRPEDVSSFPHEFSGGQRQRIAVARAIASSPRLVVLDEPVSSLDVSIRAQIMNLLKDLQQSEGFSYLFIAHHLGTVRYMSHVVGVMYLGRMMELAASEELFSNPLHPYTQALFSAALPDHPDAHREQVLLRSEADSPARMPGGCRLHPRCPFAKSICKDIEPEWKEIGPNHWTACHLY